MEESRRVKRELKKDIVFYVLLPARSPSDEHWFNSLRREREIGREGERGRDGERERKNDEKEIKEYVCVSACVCVCVCVRERERVRVSVSVSV